MNPLLRHFYRHGDLTLEGCLYLACILPVGMLLNLLMGGA